ncbi:MAG: hypothetical protein ACHP7N_16260 [Caulobacterales bacterium]
MLMALLGAVLGAIVRPRLIALPVAVGLAEGIRGLIGLAAPIAVDNIQAPFWAKMALDITESPIAGYLPLLAVSAGGSLIAGVLALFIDQKAIKSVTLAEATANKREVKGGKFVRAEGMIEKRPAQLKAEERQKALLGL